jgi:hypothetical protein
MIERIRNHAPALLRVASLVAATALLGACASIPQRAWRNGAGLSNSSAYQRALNGDRSFANYRALQSSYGSVGHLLYGDSKPFTPFSHWY